MPKNIWLPGFIHTIVVKTLVRPFSKAISKTPRARGKFDRLIINIWRKI